MFARRRSRMVALGLASSTAVCTVSSWSAKTTGTRCGRPSAPTVARRATRARANRSRASEALRRTRSGPAALRSVAVELHVQADVPLGGRQLPRADLPVAAGRLRDRAGAEGARLPEEVLARDELPHAAVEPLVPGVDALVPGVGKGVDSLCHTGLLYCGRGSSATHGTGRRQGPRGARRAALDVGRGAGRGRRRAGAGRTFDR